MCEGNASKETPVPENCYSSIQLQGAFTHSLDQEEELDWVESEFVRGQRNNSLIFKILF